MLDANLEDAIEVAISSGSAADRNRRRRSTTATKSRERSTARRHRALSRRSSRSMCVATMGVEALLLDRASRARRRACASPDCRWGMSSPPWCLRCCRWAATRRRSMPPRSNRFARSGRLVFETFISLSCQLCPDVVQALNLMAVVEPRRPPHVIDGALFQAEVEKRQVMAVPTMFLNGVAFGQGRLSLEEIIAKLDTGAGARAAAAARRQGALRRAGGGGGPAGAAAAIYSARKGIRTGIVAERFGGQLLDTVGVENFISVRRPKGRSSRWPRAHVQSYEVDVMDLQRAEALIPGELIEFAWPAAVVEGAQRGHLRPAPAGARSTSRASASTATAGSPTARIATARCSRASVSRSSAAATPASRRRSISRAGEPRHADRIRPAVACGCGADPQAAQPAERHGDHQRADHRGDAATGSASTGWSTRTARAVSCAASSSPACSCRSAWCRTPTG